MEPIFALDVGTRVVMGLLMIKNDKGYKIVASSKTEHRQRAMYDGQIHDVAEVAEAVRRVKADLEKKSKTTLTKVAVAAAGRALKTEIASAERLEPYPILWEQADVSALEMEAVQLALRKIDAVNGRSLVTYHCVGYTTMEKQLDGVDISSLIGQRGRTASLSVIATFLPRTVIDGLTSVLACVGLQLSSLTLEPIAAGYAAIPPDMRRLNLALVDIGAGTSDIALTRNGSFFAYGMVPMAGDEITESLCAQYLLDFQAGEKVKKELGGEKEVVTFPDFFGNQVTVPTQEVRGVVQPTIYELANKIAAEILELNQKVPQGVILIGGGSQIPLLADILAEILGIAPSRIGIQIRERLTNVVGDRNVQGPDAITPIGIGMVALSDKGLHYYSVMVNDLSIPIFELQLATTAEALLAAGIQPRSFLGKPGAALTYEWNGEVRIIKGSLGRPAQLLVNGNPARLDQTLEPGDSVRFTPGIPGADAEASLQDVIPTWKPKLIWWNDLQEEFSPQYLIDGQPAALEDRLTDGCKIMYLANNDLDNLCQQKGLVLGSKQITIYLNGQAQNFTVEQVVSLNGQVIRENQPINDGDRINLTEGPLTIGELGLRAENMVFNVNGRELTYNSGKLLVKWAGRELSAADLVQAGMELNIERESLAPILSDLLPQLDLAVDTAGGTKLVLMVNGCAAEFTTELQHGDQIKVYWD